MSTSIKGFFVVLVLTAIVFIPTGIFLVGKVAKATQNGSLYFLETRGQKAIDEAKKEGWNFEMATQTYADVHPGDPWYQAVEQQAAMNGGSMGFPCGDLLEPCDSQNRPYFRPYSP